MTTVNSLLEPSMGPKIANPTAEEISGILTRLGADLEHCNFTYGDSFVAAYGSAPNSIFLSYRDPSGRDVTTNQGISVQNVCQVFLDCQQGNTTWQSTHSFESLENGDQNPAHRSSGDHLKTNPTDTDSLKNAVFNGMKYSAKREVSRSISRIIGQIIRGILRSRR